MKSLKDPNQKQISSILSDFSFCISMYHALSRLEGHGLRIFLEFFEGKHFLLSLNTDLMRCVSRIRNSIEPIPKLGIPENFDFGHPKYEKLRKHLLEHFNNHKDSKSLVFCEFRDTVYLINQMLLRNGPLIRPEIFIG